MLADLRALPRAFWVLVIGVFINRFGSFVYPFLTILLSRRGLPLSDVAMVIAGYGTGGLISAVAGGWFADRFGRRNTIVAGTLANAAAVMTLYYAPNLPSLVLLTLCAGVFAGFYQPAAGALVADLIPEERRLAAYAVLRQSANAGFAFGTAAGGFLVSHSAFWLFAGDAITTASYGFIALMLLPHGLRHSSKQARWGEAIARLRSDAGFWALFASQFLCALVFSQFASSYALEITGRHIHFGHLQPEQVFGALIGWNGMLVMLLELPITRITQRFHPRRVMCIGYLLIGLGFASNGFTSTLLGLVIGMTVFTIGEMLSMPMVSTWVAYLAPESMRGRYMGALSTSWNGAGMIGPLIGLSLFGFHPMALWLTCGVWGALSAAIMARSGEKAAEQEEPEAIRLEAVDT
uniref:Major facilitator superfamily MFS_1 n=1 Tax=uncultured Verrucomicrobiota bacterium TaxID=156588 RepID=D2DXR2_9BACT|nr:major facilitator superfamily MFS_1 [uncultured Verrucomicrobiota bacterium]